MQTIKYLMSCIGFLIGIIFGEINMSLIVIMVCILIDYITGVIKGFITKELSSNIGMSGILKKVCIYIVIAIANMIDRYIFDGDFGGVRTSVIFFYTTNEILSIMENIGAIGVPLPKKIIDVIRILKENKEK